MEMIIMRLNAELWLKYMLSRCNCCCIIYRILISDIPHKMTKCSKNKGIKNLLIHRLKREIEFFIFNGANTYVK